MSELKQLRVVGTRVYFLPIETRMPLKFGAETVTSVTCARVAVRAVDRTGQFAVGWGETPLSVQWVWPGALAYEQRHECLKQFVGGLARLWAGFDATGHPLELGHDFIETSLRRALAETNSSPARAAHPMPWLAALVCDSPFDIALHDAFGRLAQRPVYETYGGGWLRRDLAAFLDDADPSQTARFRGRSVGDFLAPEPAATLPAWHLVGGLDPVDAGDLTGGEPNDGYPVLLRDWIRTDGLKCLKIKLRGNDAQWDYARIVRVGTIALEENVDWLSADFNCTVREPEYVNAILDQLCRDHPRIYGMLLYVEQPFPYELDVDRIDVRSVAGRKPLFLDESAHDWRMVRLGRELGWSGVALKTCKTQTGALLSACWARAHGMTLMVQDLTNPMLAQVPHVLLAAHAATIMGVETNSMQFYPEASRLEARVHPGLYQRRHGCVALSTIHGPGFGYRETEIARDLPAPAAEFGAW